MTTLFPTVSFSSCVPDCANRPGPAAQIARTAVRKTGASLRHPLPFRPSGPALSPKCLPIAGFIRSPNSSSLRVSLQSLLLGPDYFHGLLAAANHDDLVRH